MKKRILSILVICCMVLGLLPTTAFADNDSVKKAIQIGTSGISGYDSTNSSYDYIHFGTWNNSTVKWRVLDTKTNMANAQRGDGFFLLSEVLLGTGEYGGVEFDYTTPYFNDWKGSRGQDWCNDFYSRSLSITEQKAVLATSKSDALYGMYYDASDNILDGDKVFFLSAEEAENAAYGFTDDNARIANYGDSAYVWWLRSPRRMNPDSAGTVNEKGAVIGEWVGQTNAARPAFNLKPDSVLLVSAAVGGKGTADGMFKIPEYSGDEWKLTLLDDTRTFRVTETTAAGKPGGTVTLNFSGPRTGQNEYISAIIEGKNGATHYGRIMKPTAADRQLSFTLPHDLASGNYKLHVFSEQYNGDYQTDYASRFQTVALTVEEAATEQFALTPGGTYYFDLSGENIPGTINDDLPDKSMHYVPFTYAGAVNAYKLTSAMATTEEYAQQYKYDHSLFIADHAVTHTVSWDDLNTKSLIFGKDYVAGGVDYTLRAPSVGSDHTGSDESKRGVPQSNEWDTMLNKNSGYIQNWNGMYSWGQDTASVNASDRALRGCISARFWNFSYASYSYPIVGFRPVLEVPKPDTLGSDGLKVVTLDLGGGKLGNSSEDIQIIVKTGSEFTAPASGGLTRPDGNTGSYFMWLGSNGKLYAPGDNVPADVTKLTAQFALSEQFSLKPGGTYYFDLSAMGIPGTVNTGNEDGAVSLPDTSLHYVPFTYAGTIEAYKLTSAMATTEEYAQQNKYPHSLFVADYAVTHTVSWDDLNTAGLIFGKDYAAGGVDYTLRAPSVGSGRTYSGESQRGTPLSNEWDKILDKDSGYIKNWSERSSWGQDTKPDNSFPIRANRGDHTARHWSYDHASDSSPHVSFRPVLEVLNSDTLDSDGMKVVTLDLGGGTLGGSSDAIYIIVKTGSEFTAPASGGLTRPDGNTGSYFMWLGSNGTSYAPGASVPADVTKLTVQWTAPTYTVTLNAGNGTINSGNVTSYTYGVGATLPTDVTRTGYIFKGWYDNEALAGSPVTAISNTETGNKEYWAKWEINQYTITFDTVGGSTVASITQDYGTAIAAPADPTREGYTFIGWDKEIPSTMPAENVTVTAKWVVNQYTITFDTAGGSAVASITQDYGTAITAPANPTREGYTFIGWDKAIPATMPAENMIITANWKVNQYTITFDSNRGSEIAPITQDYGTAITAPANPTREGYTFIGWDKAIPATMPAEDLTITAQWRDIAVPTGEIKIAENGWKSFLNTITFSLFFKDTQTVTVTAADNSGEAVKIEYLLSDKALTESELAGKTFTAYSAPFSINPDNEYVIYAKLTDTSGNFAYINTNGIVLDATVPGISGIADGKTYCAAQTITVDEKYIGTVKVNGTEVSLDKNSQFALSPASGKQTIVVTDKAGNETRVTVTVNDGHTYEWQSENGQYWQKCKFCNHETAKKDIPTINISGADKVCRTQDYKFSFTLPEGATGAAYGYKFIGFDDGPLTPTVENGLYSGIIKASTYPATENSFKLIVSAKTADGFAFSAEKKVTIQNEHSGGTATCKNKAICEVCGESYGKLDPNNHASLKHIDAKAATKTSEGNIEYWYCDGCNKYYKDAKATQEITKAQTVTAKLPPKITAGDGATVTQGEKKELSFTSDASFADFLRVELDGTTLDEKNYTKKEGSTIITLNRDFVATLSVGEHTLAIVSQSGTATAKFTVKAKPAETATPQPTVTPQPTEQPQPTVQPVSPLPRTGDTANPALWFALLIVSGSALAAIFVLRRKDNRK